MKALGGEANIVNEKVFPHNLRHLFAKTFYKIDKDIAKLADLLGVKHMDLALKPAQGAIFPEGVHEIISVDAGGLHTDHDLFQAHRGERRYDFINQLF